MRQQLTKQEKKSMIVALTNFKAAALAITNLWGAAGEDHSRCNINLFDRILEENFPFRHDFSETSHDISNWVDKAIEMLNEEDVDYNKLRTVVEYNEKQLEKVNGDQNKAEGLVTLLDEREGISVWNPFMDITLRYDVDAVGTYGKQKLNEMIGKYDEMIANQ